LSSSQAEIEMGSATQVPAWQIPGPVQASPSSQLPVFSVLAQVPSAVHDHCRQAVLPHAIPASS
jgi:hypothetical protein